MQDDLQVRDDVVIPGHELEIETSRSGGPGGQHVNKSDTRITVRWNVLQSAALSDELKNRVMTNLQSQLTNEGELIVHSSAPADAGACSNHTAMDSCAFDCIIYWRDLGRCA